MRPLALFRCDASPAIGAGHVVRCLALAEELVDAGWRVAFAVGDETISTVPRLAEIGIDVAVLDTTDTESSALARQFSGEADLLVVDHYACEAAFEHACRSFAQRIVVLDDGTGRMHDCDVLVDAAASEAAAYATHVPPHARVLSGPGF